MPPVGLTLVAVFVAVAVVTAAIASLVVTRQSAGQRRLSQLTQPSAPSVFRPQTELIAEETAPFWDRLADALPTSRGTVKRLRRELALCGWLSLKAPALFSLSELVQLEKEHKQDEQDKKWRERGPGG